MIEGYLLLNVRIQQELTQIEQVVRKAEKAIKRVYANPQDQDFYIDSAALNLHDFYSGIERILQLIATTVDGNLPSSSDWHRELLRQMSLDLPNIRPPVLYVETAKSLGESQMLYSDIKTISPASSFSSSTNCPSSIR
jgi:hypothetical protein